MHGDFTRHPIGHVADALYVLQQQGRVHLDSDWNELAATLVDNLRLSFDDLLGGSAAVDGGFRPAGGANAELAFEPGTYFVDGYRVVAPAAVSLGSQPWRPDAEAVLPTDSGTGDNIFFYLDVWLRNVNFRTVPDLREVALRGPDTTTRAILTWQVRAVRIREATRADVHGSWAQIAQRIRPDARGQLRAWVDVPEVLEPCLDDVPGGYTGPGNQLYRFEIGPGDDGQAPVIRWSRDNGSVEFPVRSSLGENVQMDVNPTSSLMPGDLVELVTDTSELEQVPNPLARIHAWDPDEGVAMLAAVAWDNLDEETARLGHARLRRWDGILPLDDAEHEVEHGLRIQVNKPDDCVAADFWLVAARTTGTLIWPDDRRWRRKWPTDWPDDNRPPHGVDHHLAPLALIVGSTVLDCRWIVRPARLEGEATFLTLTPTLTATTTTPWSHQAGFAQKPPGQTAAHGMQAVALPHGAVVRTLRATGRNGSTAQNSKLRISLSRRGILGDASAGKMIVDVVATGNPYDDAAADVSPNLAVVDNDLFTYYLMVKLDNANPDDTVTVTAIQISYLPPAW